MHINRYLVASALGMSLAATAAQAQSFNSMNGQQDGWSGNQGHQHGSPSSMNQAGRGAVNPSTGEYLAPAGNGGYTGTRDGRYYAPSGPSGVVDTTTGQFIPTH